ncbi:MAG: glycosyltransferase [Leptodesmis sp.]|uniref:glycosyltransferase n=1 Tax=Leptodesmis sp. TaxID=3100501 RepID=UPI003D0D594E
MLWNPFAGWGEPPEAIIANGTKVWTTFHGGAAFSRPLQDVFGGEEAAEAARLHVEHCHARWQAALPTLRGVIVPSEYGAQEFLSLFDFPRARIQIIPHGVNHKLFNILGEAIPDVGFLHVSAGGPVKNIPRILQAYDSLPTRFRPPLTLVIPAERFTPRMDQVAGVRLISGPVSPIELATLYRGATALIHPSLWESFGMTIVEAMACGCPVLAGDNSAMREYYSGAALLVDPRSQSAIADGMIDLLNEDCRHDFQQRGCQQANQFSWEKAAEAHAQAFFPLGAWREALREVGTGSGGD